ncbi:trehalose receptor domain-containing protein [Phthorimaea operculella]|nr:trehalose receptor domain-containing protein [Phthorimaea operculella]
MAIITFTENNDTNDTIPKKQVTKSTKELSYTFSPKILVKKEEIVPPSSNISNAATFQKALRACVLIGQFFGLNPVLGINEADTSKLRFSVVSVRFIYTMITIVGQSILVLLCLMRTAKEVNPSIGTNSNLVFYGINTITTYLFLRVATKWPKLCQQIAKLEEIDPTVDGSVVRRCHISLIIVLSAALLEHMLSDCTLILATLECDPDYPLIDAYSRGAYGWAWAFFDYSRTISAIGFVLNIQCTFNWNFADVFVICISWYLTARLKQVNDRIGAVRGKYVAGDFWCKMREDYCRTTNLVRKVDNVISSVIFISFANNLLFICLQFLHILEDGMKPVAYCGKSPNSRPLKGFERPFYLIFSFGFLLARYISVSLIAAKVHTASKLPVLSLYDVPSSCYCVEVQRFIDQVHGDTVALSGLQFFYVKRGLLLTVAGTIVTYELVLMQFTALPTASHNNTSRTALLSAAKHINSPHRNSALPTATLNKTSRTALLSAAKHINSPHFSATRRNTQQYFPHRSAFRRKAHKLTAPQFSATRRNTQQNFPHRTAFRRKAHKLTAIQRYPPQHTTKLPAPHCFPPQST